MKSGPSELEKLLSTDPGQKKILQALDVRDYGRLTLTDKSMSQFFKKHHSSFWLTKLACCLAQEPHDDKVRFILKSNLGLLDIVFPKVELQSLTVFNLDFGHFYEPSGVGLLSSSPSLRMISSMCCRLWNGMRKLPDSLRLMDAFTV